MEDRKPCPFCGHHGDGIETSIYEVGGMNPHRVYSIACLECGCEGPNDLGESGAIAKWNKRVSFYNPPAVTYEAPIEARAGSPLGGDPLAGLWEDGH